MMVDFLIIMLVVYGAYSSFRRGFLNVAASLGSLVAGLAAAAAFYKPVGQFMAVQFNMLSSIANITAYIGLLLAVQFTTLMIARYLFGKVSEQHLMSLFNRAGGSALGIAQMLVFTAVGLSVFMNLPASAATKQAVTDSRLAQPLVKLGNSLQSFLNAAPSGDFQQTLNLLTVKPDSKESVELGFTTTDVSVNEAAEREMLHMVNRERLGRGLPALKVNETAKGVARAHSRDMFARGYFSHVNPDGLDPFDRMKNGGVTFQAAGENLALAPTLELAHRGLMDSPGHKANILSPDFGKVGIGIIDGGPRGLMITQNFTD
ncbi:MAG TPA: CvpA family protein [Candidatus Dormibacteraeota bacterium]|nr:CvpA family protein [Candidatus Dormibacteraeota bacterium]